MTAEMLEKLRAGRTEAEVVRAAAAMRHMDGCPVAARPDDPELAAQVEVYRAQRPARVEQRDGFEHHVAPQLLTVYHCCECGNLTYAREG